MFAGKAGRARQDTSMRIDPACDKSNENRVGKSRAATVATFVPIGEPFDLRREKMTANERMDFIVAGWNP
ncbi:hypothetical protein L3V59_18400 [Burkholderia aenigmatica]|uniref:hypothetical protein n=1 Tax=Burkholderia aenigmatica TaxID=2015348 RepID=UPI001F2CFB99|nr:hypothetical protein [Burkholderia aenigmatica]UKD14935.1 hypothetical protein L3V59_18400 [Burkholderia aenigmatica]